MDKKEIEKLLSKSIQEAVFNSLVSFKEIIKDLQWTVRIVDEEEGHYVRLECQVYFTGTKEYDMGGQLNVAEGVILFYDTSSSYQNTLCLSGREDALIQYAKDNALKVYVYTLETCNRNMQQQIALNGRIINAFKRGKENEG